MCVILVIEPGATVPLDKLELACDINKDGFGLAFKDKKKNQLMLLREVDKKNDYKEIAKYLTKYNSQRQFLHLRHATVGAVNLENCHPFFPLHRKDGLDLGMMHNGTLYDYKPDIKDNVTSDTLVFNNVFLRPLLLRVAAFHTDKTQVIEDPFLDQMIRKALGFGEGMITLFDQYGNYKNFGKNGAQFDGWWASNSYSFDKNHYRSSQKPPTVPYVYNGASHGGYSHHHSRSEEARDSLPFSKWTGTDVINWGTWEQELEKHDQDAAMQKQYGGKTHEAIKSVSDVIQKTTRGILSMVDTTGAIMSLDSKREPFLKEAGLSSYDDLTKLTLSNFSDLCAEFPNAMAELFLDLVAERERFGIGKVLAKQQEKVEQSEKQVL